MYIYTYMYVCMYVCMYACMCTYMYIYIMHKCVCPWTAGRRSRAPMAVGALGEASYNIQIMIYEPNQQLYTNNNIQTYIIQMIIYKMRSNNTTYIIQVIQVYCWYIQ